MSAMTFWGVIASPYQLKMQALADFSQLSWQRWPAQGGRLQALGMLWRLQRAKKRAAVERFPGRISDLDEYPSVPFYSLDGKQFYYDSSGLAAHLDQLSGGVGQSLLPMDAALRFVCQFIDEAYDEFGLYMVHHNRWVTSATTTPMGEVTAAEMGRLLPGIRQRLARQLPRRQVRRCPYLFSVAPAGFDAGVAPSLTPPPREGFPATHQLLDEAWRTYLAAMERLLQHQPYLLGDRFTLADASAYGQLSMNLIDGVAADLLAELAPTTFRWLCAIRDGEHKGSSGELYLSDDLSLLLTIMAKTFVPLMVQNNAAYEHELKRGQTLFNEAAFDRHQALYEGELLGQPFRTVVKTFQVAVWRELRGEWRALPQQAQEALLRLFPASAIEAFVIA